MSQKRRMTIYDIAREAGVSTATVSRVISGSDAVSPKTRARVEELVRLHRFSPNAQAMGLSKTHSGLLGMLVPDVRNPYYASIFMACEQEAYELGYTLILNNTFTREDLEIAFLEKMAQQRVEAVIICGGLIDWTEMPERFTKALQDAALAAPLIIAGQVDLPEADQLYLDHASGMRQLIDHLLSLGHRRIAFISAGKGIMLSHIKRQAFLDSMAHAGLPVMEGYIQQADHFDEDSGSRAMRALLELPESPSAVIGINDLVSAGALRCALERGLQVPHDCAVASFDNSYLSDLTVPRMTSVDYNYDAYGKQLVELAISRATGADVQAPICYPVTLQIKASTSPAGNSTPDS